MTRQAEHCFKWLSDTRLQCGKSAEARIEFTAGSEGLPRGAEFVIFSSNRHGWHYFLWALQSVRIEEPYDKKVEARIIKLTLGDWGLCRPTIIHLKNHAENLRPGEKLVLCFSGITPPREWDEDYFYYELRTDKRKKFSTEIPEMRRSNIVFQRNGRRIEQKIEYVPGAPYQIRAAAVKKGKEGNNYSLVISAEDGFGNFIKGYDEQCEVEIDGKRIADAGLSPTAKLDDISVGKRAPVRISVKTHDKAVKKIKTHPIGDIDEEWNVYFGDIHGHTKQFSDGLYSAQHYYDFARDVANVSVSALSDHYNMLHDEKLLKEMFDITDRYNAPHEFVTLQGFEWDCKTYRHHKNIYFPSRELAEELGPGTPDTTEEMFKYYEGRDVVIIPHHTNFSSEITWAWWPHDWDIHDGQTERLVEIYQMRGNSETEKFEGEWGTCDYGASVRLALDRGYKLGFIGGTDTHRSEPASSFLPHNMFIPPEDFYTPGIFQDYFGLGAFLSKELTREGIYDALKSRRTYATTGDRILLHFSINAGIMGSEITASSPPKVKIKVWGTDEIYQLDIIKNGKSVLRKKNLSDVIDLEWEDKDFRPEDGERYYYLRVRQKNKQMAWASPIWVAPLD